ncbi:putative ubiquitin-like-specific protease 2A [Heracleum sosnowskyi]|uniref:Ubiquitin-like-specific protease 2A n=1 Tax=Heracleum sosnowskyi TaxID=360622 RepID=A0AAD8MIK9_9APIA|nr:putative ubiquitin-like-specific protease 2A [Heracleum sosnowskyi]
MEVSKSTKKSKSNPAQPIHHGQRPVPATQGNARQRSVHKVTSFPSESSIMKSLERAEKLNIPGLTAFYSLKRPVPAIQGNACQRSVHQVTAFPSEPSVMKSLEHAEKSNIQGLTALYSLKHVPRRKRTKRRDRGMNAINSEIYKEQTGLEALVPSTECRRPRQKRKRKKVPACSTDSEQTVLCFLRTRGQARRRGTSNGTHQGKLDSSLLNKYLGNLWQSIPSDKKDSSVCIDCLWYTMYHKQSQREKVLRWIVRDKIISKKYVFLPICRWDHWSLLIMCHLGEDLNSKTKTPCMLLLDSLHNAGPTRLEPDIRKFLLGIYKAEKRPETKKLIDKIPFLVPKVPQQRDDKECGYFVLYYINLFLMNSPKTISITNGYPYFMKDNWFTTDMFKSFCQTLCADDQQTGVLDNLCNDDASDDVIVIE